MYEDIISKALIEYNSRTGNKTKAIKNLLYVVNKLQAEIEEIKSAAKKPAAKKPAAKKPAAKKPAAKKPAAKKNVKR
jgi:hypothetical protein